MIVESEEYKPLKLRVKILAMEPNNAVQKSPPPPVPKPESALAPAQPGVEAEIVTSIPVKQQTNDNVVATDPIQTAASPKNVAVPISKVPKTPQKAPQSPKTPEAHKPQPAIAITVACLVVMGLAAAAFFAFRSS